jgi:hypothetical protein
VHHVRVLDRPEVEDAVGEAARDLGEEEGHVLEGSESLDLPEVDLVEAEDLLLRGAALEGRAREEDGQLLEPAPRQVHVPAGGEDEVAEEVVHQEAGAFLVALRDAGYELPFLLKGIGRLRPAEFQGRHRTLVRVSVGRARTRRAGDGAGREASGEAAEQLGEGRGLGGRHEPDAPE